MPNSLIYLSSYRHPATVQFAKDIFWRLHLTLGIYRLMMSCTNTAGWISGLETLQRQSMAWKKTEFLWRCLQGGLWYTEGAFYTGHVWLRIWFLVFFFCCCCLLGDIYSFHCTCILLLVCVIIKMSVYWFEGLDIHFEHSKISKVINIYTWLLSRFDFTPTPLNLSNPMTSQ